MKFYFAPMEGITGYVFRQAHHTCYPGMDAYFTPFISPNQHHAINPKEHRDIEREHNRGISIIPQVLTNKPELFLQAARELKQTYDYSEINFNLGCPSKTVVSKGKGSGMLAEPEQLERFFDAVFSTMEAAPSNGKLGEAASPYPRVSIKTRLGLENVEEFPEILRIYSRYPLSELIIHPRVQKEFYKGTPHWEVFAEAVKQCPHSLCYNGDICCRRDYLHIKELFPTVQKIMIGRGLLANPELVQQLQEQEIRAEDKKELKETYSSDDNIRSYKTLKQYHDLLLAGYLEQMNGDTTNVLFKMKELWSFLGQQFPEERLVKKMIKAKKWNEYQELVEQLFG